MVQDHQARLKEDLAFLASALQQARHLKQAAATAAAEALAAAQTHTAAHKVRTELCFPPSTAWKLSACTTEQRKECSAVTFTAVRLWTLQSCS